MTEKIVQILRERYIRLSLHSTSHERICKMMNTILDNYETWPLDKTGRWLGYVQCLIIEVEGRSTVEEERDFTRPLFHEYYDSMDIDPPLSIKI